MTVASSHEPPASSKREVTMAAKFVVKKRPIGKFRFSLRAGNGEIIATSEA